MFVLSLALMPVIALTTPRFLAFWPGIIGLLSLPVYHFSFGHWPEIPKKILFFVFIILGLAGLSSLWALDSEFAVERTGKMALILLPSVAFIAVSLSVPLASIRPYLKILPLIFGVVALIACAEMIFDFPVYRLVHGTDFGGRVTGSNLNRTVIAILAMLFIMAGIARSVCSSKLVMALFAVSAFMVLLTSSQSAQLGFIFAMICFFVFPYSHKKVWLALGAFLSLAVLAAPFLAMWLFDSFAGSVNAMPFLGKGGGYGGERLEIWDGVARYALQSPLYGFGIEATRAVEAFDIEGLYRKGVTELHPHNFAIQLWIEFGIIGVGICMAFLMSLFNALSHCNFRQAQIALPSFVILFAAASFGYGLWQSWFLGLIVFTIALARLAMRLYEEENVVNDV